jgi:Restriction endonuclease
MAPGRGAPGEPGQPVEWSTTAVAKPSEKDLEYIKRTEAMSWKDLNTLWERIKADETPDWEGGKAFEHLVVRAFKLNGLEAEYPYDVPPGGKPIEQIDGLVHLQSHTFLIECKDRDSVDIEAIAKLRNQLLRRPETTLGCVFTTGEFTEPALIITDFSVPHRILLWSGFEIEDCLKKENFGAVLLEKYRFLCKYGLTDHSPNYKGREV